MLTSSNIEAWSKYLFSEQQCLEYTFCICSLTYFGNMLSWREDLRTSYVRLKAVEMLQSSTHLAKNHGDDLGLEYLWNGDEQSSLENSLKAMEKNA